ncbi:MAG: response regulator, partial [Bacteroidota bacterium]
VVDDEPDAAPLFLQRFRREVRKGEVLIRTAESGTQALDILQDFHKEVPLLILSDINMPGMNGIQLLQEVRERYPDLKIFMVSAYYHNPTYQEAATNYGADDFIPKPINFPELKEKIFGMV